MNLRVFIIALGLASSPSIHAFTVSLDTGGGIVADHAFTNPSAIVSETVDSGTTSDGFDFETRVASASFHTQSTVNLEHGGGTRVTDSHHTLNSSSRDKEVHSENSLSFSSKHDFHSTLQVDNSMSTYGSFVFVLQANSTTMIDLTRTFRFIADQPIHISLSFAGQSSTGGLNDMLSGLYLIGGDYQFSDIIYFFSEADEVISSTGSGGGIDFQASGTNVDNNLQLDFLIEPSDTGTAPEVELRWFIKQESEIGPHLILRTQSEFWDTSASFEEMAVIQKVPEPDTLLLCVTTLPTLWRRSRGRKTRLQRDSVT